MKIILRSMIVFFITVSFIQCEKIERTNAVAYLAPLITTTKSSINLKLKVEDLKVKGTKEFGFCISPINEPTANDLSGITIFIDEPAKIDEIYSVEFANLLTHTKYFLRAFISNGTDYYYSSLDTARTQMGTPVLQTLPANNIDNTSATLNLDVLADGGSNIDYLKYIVGQQADLSDGIGDWKFFGHGIEEILSDGISLSQSVTTLIPNTTYYFQACAKNVFGEAKGEILSFTTSDN